MRGREAFPSCETCGAVVRRTLMHFHRAWHDEATQSHSPDSDRDVDADARAADG